MGARKRIKADKIMEARKNIAFAKLNNCPTSPRKMRIVADLVRGKDVDKALDIFKLIIFFSIKTDCESTAFIQISKTILFFYGQILADVRNSTRSH